MKTSLAPGSQVVTDYLDAAGLTPYLEQLGFYLVGYGCTTCIGNSGPLPEEVSHAIDAGDLVVASVLSGNRNFEGRIQSQIRANYLASPPLVVAYALAGTMDIDFETEPIGTDSNGEAVLPARHLAEQHRDRRGACATACSRRCSSRSTPTSSPATTPGGTSTCPTATSSRGTPSPPTSASPRTSRA